MKKILLITLLSLFLPSYSFAVIHIVIEEASSNKFPIALQKIQTETGGTNGLTKKMTDLIRKDLNVTGIFRVLDENSTAVGDSGSEVNFKKWEAIEAKALIHGVMKGDAVEIRLYDIAEQKMVFGKRYVVNNKNYVDAVHRFMDGLLKQLTGKRGPFESRIAASCGKTFKRNIVTFEMDGARRGQLTSGAGNHISPTWHPSGKYVAFVGFDSKFPEVYLSTSKRGKRITNFQSTTITPAFSPDGSKIVLATATTGDTELHSVSSSGKSLGQLTKSANIDLAPAFSPDGSTIVFSSERAGGLNLFSMNASGGGAKRLTFGGYQNDQADWSPDGSKIVFSGKNRGSAFAVFVMDADGSNIQRVTPQNFGNSESPSWAPDSRYIAYSSRGSIYVALEDGGSHVLIPGSGGCLNPEWGPWLTKEE